ncbi:FAD-dependent oxidoreductase [Pseudoalteromonas denitrificans]|uniref:2-octaprenyl-3-methyl-6-methoxy-1,4-benzoquinol hydroxylase n=1 Tax=Pseudoalteromonas denitrificans DSM 6059 TaxID=1123010 RepID=A0A1I1F6M3_9GAMM|nr:FAD-dependent oxidoreductase [Pseudoalteromonas denitrificans]SFB92803.1 2-octaprenyl-3-methyl-6-methoxy-1,4-benzoquinol hydroxylase [Pseudoalteromonas denitrificans DSM 6059]
MKNQIVIVGGGMVGATAAVKLAKQGHQITLIEHQAIKLNDIDSDNIPDIRISALNRFSEKLLDEIGAMAILKQGRIAPYTRLSVCESLESNLEFNASDIGESHLGHIIENKLIQSALWQQFERFNIKVVAQSGKLKNITQNNPESEKITIEFENITFEVDLIIAADGGQSQCRKLAGIGSTGWQYQQSCMGILIKLNAPQQDITWQQFQPTGPVAFLPLQAPYASLIWYHHSKTLDEFNQLSKHQLKEKIIDHYPELAGDFEIINQSVFPLTRSHANQYFKGRLVLVGDAAHTINPLAGQGVNLGFKDVAALAQVLENADDVGCNKLLREYESKRRNANLLMMSVMDACYGVFSNDIKPLKHLRQFGLKVASKTGPIKNQILKYAIGDS